jgi:hypothetical protein
MSKYNYSVNEPLNCFDSNRLEASIANKGEDAKEIS